jgi:hypothetical protein
MSDPAAAAEHLKLIRGMMERATVYRAISAPAAIFGGLLACITAGYLISQSGGDDPPMSGGEFFWTWVAVLVISGAFNGILLWRNAKSVGDPLWSPGMRLAMMALAPAMLAGGAISYGVLGDYDEFVQGVVAWVLCYGAALLAMGGVAPRSIRRLGWLFLSAGLILFVLWRVLGAVLKPQFGIDDVEAASWMMILTFGLLHLIHGAGVLIRRSGGNEDV